VAIYEIEFTASGWDTSTPPKRIKDATFVQPVLNRLSLNASLAVGTPSASSRRQASRMTPGRNPSPCRITRLASFRNIWVTIHHY
jgi:hypothetical protein